LAHRFGERQKVGHCRASDIEEYGFLRPLQVNVEAIDVALARPEERVPAGAVFDTPEDRILGIGGRLVGKIEPGIEPQIDAAGDDPETDMGRLQPAIGERHAAGLDGLETELAALGIGGAAAPAGEVGVSGAPPFARAGKQALGVGLPDFHHAVAQRGVEPIEHAADDGEALALGFGIDHAGAEISGKHAADAAEIRRHADMHIGAAGLRRGFLEGSEGLRHQLPSSRFSNRVERRTRSTISNFQAVASIGMVAFMSRTAVNCSIAAGSLMVRTIGQSGISGSPSKYIWVMRRCAKPEPNTEKWIWAGRQSLTPFGQG